MDSSIVLHINLKAATTKNITLQVFGQPQEQYLYILTFKRLTMKYKT